MGFFNKIKNAAESVASNVQQTAESASRVAGHFTDQIHESAETVGSGIINGGKRFVNGFEDLGSGAINTLKEKALQVSARVLDFKDELKEELDEFVETNKSLFELLSRNILALAQDASSTEISEMKNHIRNRSSSDEVQATMNNLGSNFRVQEMNQEVERIGKFQTWSFQLSGEANLILGLTGAIGYATPIFTSSGHKTVLVLSGELDAGAQQGVGAGISWGWWASPPDELEGVSLLLSGSGSWNVGLGVTGYWDVEKNAQTGKRTFQGFAVTPFAGVGFGDITFEAAGGVSLTKTF